MSSLKLLIDTNVFISLEDPKQVNPASAEIVRKCGEHAVEVFIHEAAILDISRDKDDTRKKVSLSKLQKFQKLKGPKLPERAVLEGLFGPIKNENDQVDVAQLYAAHINAVDFVITEDKGIHDRVKLTPLAGRVLTIADALSWLRRSFDPTPVNLPLVEEKRAHEIDRGDDIFDSLRDGYPEFDQWWEKCVKGHRRCWVVTIAEQLAGLVVRKDETADEAKIKFPGSKILKLCTFKVRPEFRGEKLGELLLKQALWFVQKNNYDVIYLTTFENQGTLIRVLEYYGFVNTLTRGNGELVYEKKISRQKLILDEGNDLFNSARLNYPRFVAGTPANFFCVPIKGEYHNKLFPEIAFTKPLPLFPNAELLFTPRGSRVPGNTIRKVYLCRSKTKAIKPGDILLFYQSKTMGLVGSQSITSVGVVESVGETGDEDELIRLTAKRSVFSEAELRSMISEQSAPVRVIDFLLVGHLDPFLAIGELIRTGVFNDRPPQSICLLPAERAEPVRESMQFGFEV